MRRIILMVLYNLPFVPYWWWQLCHFAKHTDDIPEPEKYALLKKIVLHANKGGRVKIDVHGREHIPTGESFVFFPNHQGLFDVLAIIEACDQPFSVVAKKEVKDVLFLKQVFAIMKAKIMDREDVRQSLQVILDVTQEVKNGRNYLIFPEGTRSRRGNQVGDFKGGSFKCAVKAKAPIVPVALLNAFEPFDRNSIAPVTVQVHFLEPIPYEVYQSMKTTEIAEIVKTRIEETIAEYEK
ncbi:lysophospholipid acyltransferase family protein [Laedolimicola ammoniilytica]|uniref:1-acyl-sn-glycerol-3-phosphate acyltransferase n=1 Tax=Laedolimicola ammoniilytica TaxID=2981771 RepID=A0ABT2RTG4_9FIRM|nr:lysophospholipid acyltransferase family protein [Laedolimicola ammoniilytica]MCU6695305.1 1-acyl-sn-glycerol-3-phosphate acyltransferase [Laedolimicola ammoniilytica]SCG91300.1 1-acyl-sn-glycerol-3-phosphate acyltransferase [uncultured Clostridium sp.]SCH77229.1 1-acyl-sn-glycerol-3-phosphate acyltransferase [uncultured Clostridium sp.]